LDANGTKVASGTSLSSITAQLFGAEVHFPFIDVEVNPNGFIIELLDNTYSSYSPVKDIVYWDDTDIVNTKTNPSNPKVNGNSGNGISSGSNGHKWGNYTTANADAHYGDAKTMDTWAYAPGEQQTISGVVIQIKEADLQVNSVTPNITSVATGDIVIYTVGITNAGPTTVDGTKPAIFTFYVPNGVTINPSDVTFTSSNGAALSSTKTFDATTRIFKVSVDMPTTSTGTFVIPASVGTLTVDGSKINAYAAILRPADVSDPNATNPSLSIPAPRDPFEEATLIAYTPSIANNFTPTAAQLTIINGATTNNIKENIIVNYYRTVCIGGTLTLPAATGGSGTVAWSSNATGTASVGATTGIATGVATGDATITRTKTGTTTTTFLIRVKALVTVATVGTITQPTCSTSTGSVVLSGLPASGSWTITDSNGGGTTTGSGASFTVTGLSTGTHTFTVNNGACSSTATSNVVINAVPTPPTAPTVGTITQTTCSTATGSVVLSGLPASGTWTITDSNGGATTTGTGTSTTLSSLAVGTHTFTVTNATGCTSSASANVVINVQPTAPTAPTVGTITQPTLVLATGSVTLNGLPAVGTWTITDSNGGGTTTGTGTSRTISLLTQGTHTFTVTNASGCTSPASANVIINTAPVANPDVNNTNEDVTLTVIAANGLLTNDTDVNSNTLTVTKYTIAGVVGDQALNSTVTMTGVGTINIQADGSYVFVPAVNYSGTVPVITYTISDGTLIASSTLTLTINPVNDAPVANPDVNTTAEDVTLTVANDATGDILLNDTDVEGSTLTVTKYTIGGTDYTIGTSHLIAGKGTVTINANGSYTFVPVANFNGAVDVITYTITDGTATASSTLTLTVTPVNDAPVANPDVNTTAEDVTLTVADGTAGDILLNDTDVEGNTLTVTKYTIGGTDYTIGTSHLITGKGTVTINANGSYTFVPVVNFNGAVDVITYTITDGTATASSTLTLTVTPVNDAPVANPDVNSTAEDVTLTVADGAAGDILLNDTDVEGSTLTVTKYTIGGTDYTIGTSRLIAGKGTVTINANGSYTFVPVANFNGAVDVITYTITDGTATASSTLTLTVTPVNDPPIAVADVSNTNKNTTLTVNVASGLLSNDTDVDGNTLTVTKYTIAGVVGDQTLNSTVTIPGVGTINIKADGSYVFVPANNYDGAVPVITYTITDGTATASSTLTLTINSTNAAPVANPDVNTTAEDVTLTVTAANGLLNNDTDLDGNTLTVTKYTIAGVAGDKALNSDVAITGVGTINIKADGSYVFVPAPNYNGTVPVISYTITDGIVTASSTLTLTVTPVNDAPVANPDVNTTAEDVTLTVNAAGGLIPNDTDVDGNTLTVTKYTIGGTDYTIGTSHLITGKGTVTVNADGSYTFVPIANFNGAVDVITYTITDGAATASSTLTLTVTPVNDPPIAVSDANNTNKNITLTVNAANGLLNNDTDVDGNTLTVTKYTIAGVVGDQALNSTVTIPSVGTINIKADGSYVFVPANNYDGAVPVITYTITDGTATASSTLTLTINSTNAAPVANPDVNTTAEDVTLTVADGAAGDILLNDTDVDGNALTVTKYTIGGTDYAIGTSHLITGKGTITVNANGSYTFVPVANFNGAVDVITYTITDGTATASSTLTLTVTPVNDPPIAVADANNTNKNITLTVNAAGGLLINDTDIDGNTLTVTKYTIAGVAGDQVLNSDVTMTGVGTINIKADGSYVFVPANNYDGAVPLITYTITDGTATASSTLTLTINSTNAAPVANPDAKSTNEDVTLTVNAAAGLLNNDTDADANTLTVTKYTIAGVAGDQALNSDVTMTGVGTINIKADGSYVFVPVANYNGTVPVISYTITDGTVTASSTLTITINPINDAPIANPDTNTTNEDVTLTVADGAAGDILLNDTDVDGNTLTVTKYTIGGTDYTAGTSHLIAGKGTVTVNANGSYTFVPVANFNGAVDVITYTITDGTATASSTLTLTVTPVNDAPVANPDVNTTAEDVTLTVADGAAGDILLNDTDVEGNTLTVTKYTIGGSDYTAGTSHLIAGKGTITINANGSYTFVPIANFNGAVDVITYTITDGTATASSTLTLTVTPVNDPPIAVADVSNTNKNTTLTVNVASGLLSNDTDVDGNTLTVTKYTIAGVVGDQTLNSTVTIPGVGTINIKADGSYVFVPANNYDGAVPLITYTITDGTATASSTLTLTINSTNAAPVANPDVNTTAEDVTLTVNAAGGLIPNDTDVDGNTLTVTKYTIAGVVGDQALNSDVAITGVGTINIKADGSYVLVPVANYNGTVPVISYTITDGTVTASSTLTLTVTPVNDAPVANPDVNTTAEDVTLTVADGAAGDILLNDTDVEGNTLTVTKYTIGGSDYTAGTSHLIAGKGTITINANGSYTFVPVANFNGAVDVITYTITDGTATASSTLTLTVTPVNDPPIAVADVSNTNKNTTLTVNVASGLLSNDTDVDGNTLTVTKYTIAGVVGDQALNSTVTIPGVGTINIKADGSYVFVPANNYDGAVPLITYTITDGTATASSTLTLTINSTNAAPVANPDVKSTNEDITLTVNAAAGLLNNDTDADANTLMVTKYTIAGVAGDQALNSDVTMAGVGTINIKANGSYVFAPALNYNGAVPVITYTITDGTVTASSTLTITINPINDAPIANPDVNTTAEDVTLTVNAAGGLIPNDTDVDGNTLSVTKYTIGGTDYTIGTSHLITGQGTVTINANGSYTFVPVVNFNGAVDVITYTITDGTATAFSTLTLTVTPVNDAPVANPDVNTTAEDVTLTVADGAAGDILLNDTDIDGNALTVTKYTIGGTDYTAGTSHLIAGKGTITVNADGSYVFVPVANFNGAVDVITYTITDGTATASSTLTLTVTPVNDAPVANPDVNTTPEDVTLTVNAAGGLIPNDTDIDGNTLTVTKYAIAGVVGDQALNSAVTITGVGTINIKADGSYVFVPAPNYNGAVPVITYTITDGTATASSTLTLTVTPVNDTPVANPDVNTTAEDVTLTVANDATGDILLNDTDVDGNTLTVTKYTIGGTDYTIGTSHLITGKGTITVNVDGSYVFVPVANFNGAVDVITYTITDGTATASSTLTLTVTPVNDAPVANPDVNTTAEDVTLTVTAANGLLNNDTDVDGNTLTVTKYTIAGVAGDQALNSDVAITGVGTINIKADGSYVFVPAPNYNGAVPVITYTITDGTATASSALTLTITPVNDAPVANPDVNTTAEDVTLTVNAAGGLIPNDTDIDGNTLTVTKYAIAGVVGDQALNSAVTITGVGTINIKADGSYVFVPVANFNGAVPVITYTITDGTATASSTLTLTVTPVNDAPVANPDTNTTNEDVTLTVNAAGGLIPNDTDIDGNTLTVTKYTIAGVVGDQALNSTVTITGVGTINIKADGSYVFVPAPNYNGAVPVITYTITDGTATASSTLTLAVTPINDVPVANPDVNTTAEDVTLTVNAAGGLIPNDTDVDGNTLTVTKYTIGGTDYTIGTSHLITGQGTITINANGSYTFVPVANFNGAVDVITYTITDGTATSSSTLTLTVTPVNDAPVANPDVNTTAEDVTLTVNTAGGLIPNDTDVDGNTLTVTKYTIGGTDYTIGTSHLLTGKGTITVNADGSYVFVPVANFNGAVDVITYTITDGTATASSTLTLTVTPVNDAPVANPDVNTTAEDVTLTVTAANGLLNNDTDVDGNTLTVTKYTIAGVAGDQALNSDVAITGVGTINIKADGSYVFVPAPNYNGAVPVITYTITDGTATASSALTLTVTPVNDAPVANPDVNTTAEDVTLTVNAAGGLIPNDTDVDGNTLTVTKYTIGGTDYTAGTSHLITGKGTITVNADGSYVFVPVANFNGAVDVITYTITDGTATASSTLTLTVTPVNDAPVANPDVNTTAEDVTLTVNTAGGLIPNDTDVDGNTLTVTKYTIGGTDYTIGTSHLLTGKGTITVNADGSYVFVPVANFNGAVDVITYTITDGTATASSTLTLTVTPVNDAPVANPDVNTTAEDVTLTVTAANGLLNNDTDVDGNTLTVTKYTIAGVAGDQALNSDVAITGVGTINIKADGSYVFVPAPNYNGAVPVITYTITDGTATASSALTLTITPVNDAPVANPDVNTTAEDVTLTVNAAGGLIPNDTDVDGNTLTVTKYTIGGTDYTAGTSHLITGKGTITVNADGSYVFVPVANFNGAVDVITYTITDGTATASSTLTLTVTPVNDAPVANPDVNTTAEDVTLTVADGAAGDILLNDTDIDGNALTVSKYTISGTDYTAGTSHLIAGKGTITVNADGSYVFVPVANFNGAVDVITYTITDGTVTASSTLTLTVTPVNDAPVANPDVNTTAEDVTLTVADGAAGDILLNDTDVDGNALTVSKYTIGGTDYTAGTSHLIAGKGTITVNADGSYVFVPVANFNGAVDVITYTITDGTATASSTLTLTVTPVNDAPVANPDVNTTAEDVTLTVTAANGLLNNDTDVDGNTLTVTKYTIAGVTGDQILNSTVTMNGVGTINIKADGSYVFVPAPNYNGAVPVITYTITDGTATASSTLTLTVTPVNDAPVANPDVNTTAEDVTLTVTAANGLLSNDTDLDGNTLTVAKYTIAGVMGDQALNSDITMTGVGMINIKSDGSYVFTPAANYNGVVPVITYTITDGTATTTSTLTLTVTPVNDIPSFIKGADQTININTPIQTITTWATALSKGPANESGQNLSFIVTNNNNPLFSAQPTIAANGTLIYTPATDKYGKTIVTVIIKDDGGIANRGVDQSLSQTFEIIIKPVGVSDSDLTPMNTAVTTTVIANDGTSSIGTSVIVGGTSPANGSITINADRSITYTPNNNYVGPDTYTYVLRTPDGVDSDPITVSINVYNSKITVTKEGVYNDFNGNSKVDVGDRINYTFIVTNTGTVPVTNVTVADNNAAVSGGPIASLAVGATNTATFTAYHVLTQADIDNSGVYNLATVTAKDPKNNNVMATSTDPTPLAPGDPSYPITPPSPACPTCTITPIVQLGSMSVTKDGTYADTNADGKVSVGDRVNYAFNVVNTGNVTLTNITVADNNAIVSGGPITLLVGANNSTSFTGYHVLTQADIDNGGVFNVATATGKDPKNKDITATSTDPTPLAPTDPSYPVTPPAPACPTCTVTPVIQSGNMTITKDGTYVDTNGDGKVNVGDRINYTFKVTNTGNVTLTNVTVTDNNAIVAGGPITSFAVGAVDNTTFTAYHVITFVDLDKAGVFNIATVTAKDPKNKDITATSTDPTPLAPTDPTYPITPPVPACPTCTVTPLPQTGSMRVVKDGTYADSNADGRVSVGDRINYTFNVINTGNVTLTNISIVDNNATVVGGPLASLAAGANDNTTFTAFHVLTQADIDNGGVFNVATATGKDPKGTDIITKSDDPTPLPPTDPSYPVIPPVVPCPTCTVTPVVQIGSMALSKDGAYADTNADGKVSVGDRVNYTFNVVNTGNVTLTNVTVTDNNAVVTGGPIMLAVGANNNTTFTAYHVLTQADIDNSGVYNLATVTAKDPKNNNVTATSTDPTPLAPGDPSYPITPPSPACPTCTITPIVQLGSMSVTKDGTYADTNADGKVSVGDRVNYAFNVVNTGNVTLTNITVADNNAIVSGGPITLLVGANNSTSFTGYHVLTQADIDNGGVFNVATATGKDPKNKDITATSTDPTPLAPTDPSYPVTPPAPACPTCTVTPVIQSGNMTITKDGTYADTNGDGKVNVGDRVNYVFAVTNTGNVTLTNVTVTDNNAIVSGTPIASLAVGTTNTTTFTAYHILTQVDIDNSGVYNLASVTAKDPKNANITVTSTDPTPLAPGDPSYPITPPVPACPTCTITPIVQLGSLSLTKDGHHEDSNGDGKVNIGDRIMYTFVVTNTGNVTLTNVIITDPNAVMSGGPLATLAVGASNSTTFTAIHAITQADLDNAGVFNLATVTAKDPKNKTITTISTDPTLLRPFEANPINPPSPACPTCTIAPLPQSPSLRLIKTGIYVDSNSDGVTNVGDHINYSFKIENTGNVTVKDIKITDPKVAVTGGPITLAPGVIDQTTFKAIYSITQADIDKGGVYNIATATGKNPRDGAVTDLSENGNASGPGVPPVDPTCPTCTITPLTPPVRAIRLIKMGAYVDTNADGKVSLGDQINYTFSVQNIGGITISDIVVTDPKVTVTGGPITLAANATDNTTFKAIYSLTQADIDKGAVYNLATATGKDGSGNFITDDSENGNTIGGPGAPPVDISCPTCTITPLPRGVLRLTKSGTYADTNGDGRVNVGDRINYTFKVENVGSITLTGITITDAKVTVTGGPINLNAGAVDNTTFKAAYTITQADIDRGAVYNVATATGKDPQNVTVTDQSESGNGTPGAPIDPTCVPCTITPLTPLGTIRLIKSSTFVDFNGDGKTNVGDRINYTFSVQNTGNVTISNILIADTKVSVTGGPIALAPGASDNSTFKAVYTVTQTDIDRGAVYNVATATGKDPQNNTVTDQSESGNPPLTGPGAPPIDPTCPACTITPLPLSGSLRLIKSSTYADFNGDGRVNAGDRINYVFSVQNTGNVTVSNITVTDTKVTVTGGPITLAPGATDNSTFRAVYTVSQADMDRGAVYNIATATGRDPQNNPVTDVSENGNPPLTGPGAPPIDPTCPACTITPLAQEGKIVLVKKGTFVDSNGDGFVQVGEKMTYTFTVTNTGTVPITGIVINDAKIGAVNLPLNPSTLAPNATGVATGEYSITRADIDLGRVINTAIATGKDPNGREVSDVSGNAADNNSPTENVLPAHGGIVDVPNILTPNGDGKNDVFIIIGRENYESLELEVFNRWGNQVYRNRNYKSDWMGDGLNEGTYFYTVRLKRGKSVTVQKGWVLIKR
jgi:gliding motility-associated-like protein